jgi:hypothetical protein
MGATPMRGRRHTASRHLVSAPWSARPLSSDSFLSHPSEDSCSANSRETSAPAEASWGVR